MSATVTLENVTLSYRRHPAVHHVSGCFKAGSLTAVTGPNGGGKSTLLKAVAGLMKPDHGRIHLEGATCRQIAYLPQASAMERDFPMTVLHMAATGFWRRTGGFGEITPALREQARQALAAVGLEGFGGRDLAGLSSGQFQRASFARLMLQDAPLILLDEPFATVDDATAARLMEIMTHWHREGRTILCVLHDAEHIRRYFPECLLLAREIVAWGDPAKALRPEKLFYREGRRESPEACERRA